MTHDPIRLSFRIDAYKPDTIPMARLAEYMAELAAVIGERDSVHFVELRAGSVQLVHDVQYEAFPKVEARARAITLGDAPTEALNAYRAINKKLAEDNTFATYAVPDGGAEILTFPGVRAPRTVEIFPVDQAGVLDGIVIGIGGRGSGAKNAVPIIVDTGDTICPCVAARGLAKQLGHYILDAPRRFHGQGQWLRDERGLWALKRFIIQSHDELDTTPLAEVVRELRKVPSEFSNDPWSDLMQDRRDQGEPH